MHLTARLRYVGIFCVLAFMLLTGRQPTGRPAAATFQPQDPAPSSSSALAFSADGNLLLAVNPDSNSVSVIDPAAQTLLAEILVGVDPRTVAVDSLGQRAYVANRGSDSISAIDLVAQTVVGEAAVGDRPYGIVVSPDGRFLYVAEQGVDQVTVLDAESLAHIHSFSTADRPSGLALLADGRTLYITHLLSNQITVLEPRPYRLYLPLIFKGSAASSLIAVSLMAPTAQTSTASIQLFADSNLVQSIVIDPDGTRAYLPHTRSITSNPNLTFDTTVDPIVSLIDLDSQQHLLGQQINLANLVDPPGVGLPFDAAVNPAGTELWVVNAASNDLMVVDLATGSSVAYLEVQDNPRGIALSPNGANAFVNNTLAGTLSVIDTVAYTVTKVITVTDIPLPPLLLNGKRLFHSSADPRMAQDRWISCNTCHFEGEHDGRTWTFGFAGPRNTTSLLGMIETYPLRWSAEWDESADSEFANRKENFGAGLLAGPMNCTLDPPDCVSGDPNQGLSYDLDSLAAFIDSLLMPLSPAHAQGEPLTPAELRGQAIYEDPSLECVTCHPAPLYTNHQRHDVGTATADEQIGPEYDTPSLRGLYNSAPYFHDGSAATLYDSLTFPSPGGEHDLSNLLTEEEIQDLIAFLLALPYVE